MDRERTREVLRRHLPGPPATVVDVGGGAGVHALWLSSLGYDVHLSDPVPLHVEQAKADARKQGLSLASAAARRWCYWLAANFGETLVHGAA